MKLNVEFKMWLTDSDGNYVIGKGTYRLLEAINEAESIKKAAEKCGMSYDYAWKSIKKIERRLGVQLVERKRGGRSGGSARLTNEGLDLLNAYKSNLAVLQEALSSR